MVRGDVHHIRIGSRTSIQDNSVVHVTHDTWPTIVGNEKRAIRSNERMETPVLYFYAGREMNVDVSVAFPKGLITEWFPRVRDFRPMLSDSTKPLPVAGGWVRWGNVRIVPKDQKIELPNEGESNHYYHARDTDSDYVRVCGTNDQQKTEFEKFLFYRGVGNFPLPMSVKAGESTISLANPTTRDLGAAFALTIRKDGSGQYRALGAFKAGASMEVLFDGPMLAKKELISGIGRELEESLVKVGLYRKEAASMVKTWTDSYFETEGTRILYLLPEAMTNELLPLHITPVPTELKRVLVARVDIITPEQTKALQSLIRDLASDTFDVRDDAQKRIAAYGRFAEPSLKEVVRTTTDSEVKSRAKDLLDGLEIRR